MRDCLVSPAAQIALPERELLQRDVFGYHPNDAWGLGLVLGLLFLENLEALVLLNDLERGGIGEVLQGLGLVRFYGLLPLD
jgi:hypothetical protein